MSNVSASAPLPPVEHVRPGLWSVPASPLAGGLLAGGLGTATEGRRASDRIQAQLEADRETLESWEALCGELGEAPADVALAWLLHHPAVTAPIIGPRTVEQFTGSLRAPEISLEQATLDALDSCFRTGRKCSRGLRLVGPGVQRAASSRRQSA
jgi:aryl-alcohol dehydrogenase-like predicted oxidoreductase